MSCLIHASICELMNEMITSAAVNALIATPLGNEAMPKRYDVPFTPRWPVQAKRALLGRVVVFFGTKNVCGPVGFKGCPFF